MNEFFKALKKKKIWEKEKKKLGAVMYTFNASTQEWKQVRLYEFKSRLIYIK